MSSLNLFLGDYKDHPIKVFGGGFEKVNVITGMKGGGKSHIAKGIISEGLKAGMSTVVFDINNEYDKVSPNAIILKPGVNLKFRLDFIKMETLFHLFERLAPFPEKTAYLAYAKIPKLIAEYTKNNQKLKESGKEPNIPDLEYLMKVANQVIEGNEKSEAISAMKQGYLRSLEIIQSYGLIMTASEAKAEDNLIKGNGNQEAVTSFSLRTVFNDIFLGTPQVLVFQIGGLQNRLQKGIVSLVLDHLKESCDKQTKAYQEYLKTGNKTLRTEFPVYPTVFFEEAHIYMDTRDIDDLVPLIRHIGINVFFVTNTPGELPDSVFRLLDNLIMTRMVNRKDIDRLADCGLTDKETIVGFAQNLKEHHALFLSGKEGATKNFPLVFHVRDFGLEKSGQTRSQWDAMLKSQQQQKAVDKSSAEAKQKTPDLNTSQRSTSSKSRRKRKTEDPLNQ
ncbi:MAG: helicase HerA-like domain-containing protein [Phormidium sp.]